MGTFLSINLLTMGRGSKKMKDANRPKRAPSAYFLFLDANRPKFTEELKAEGKTGRQLMIEISQVAGKRWNETSDFAKMPFVEKSKILKAEYTEKMEVYKQTDDFKNFQVQAKAHKLKHKIKKIVKPASAPKKPASAYFVWLESNRERFTQECRDNGCEGRLAPHVMRLA